MPVTLTDLELAFDWAAQQGNYSYIHAETGAIHGTSDWGDDFEPEPKDFPGEQWLEVPSDIECGLGSELVYRFLDTVPGDHDTFFE